MLRRYTPLLIFLSLSAIFVSPVFLNIRSWGRGDWDYLEFMTEVPRRTILEYHQMPLWNPYYCGGNLMLANPQSAFLSPLFALIVMFGTVYGLKLLILIHMIIGLMGMYMLSRELKLSPFSSYLPPVVFMLSALYPLHVAEGHDSFFSMAFIPFIFLYYLKAQKRTKYAILPAGFLALMLFSGSYMLLPPVFLFLGTYSVIEAIRVKKMKPVMVLAIILGAFILLSAIKLFPMVMLLSDYPRKVPYEQTMHVIGPDADHVGLKFLYGSLLKRGYAINNRLFPGQRWGPWEYGAYVGVIPLLLFILAMYSRKRIALSISAALFLLISMAELSPVNIWLVLHKVPLFGSIRTPSRFIVMFVFCLAILAGTFLSRIEKKRGWFSRAALILIVIVAADLVLANRPFFSDAFIAEPVIAKKNPFFQYEQPLSFAIYAPYSTLYPSLIANRGITNCYEPLHLKTYAAPAYLINGKANPEYRGEAYLSESGGWVRDNYFSPNRVSVDLRVSGPDMLVINQNYYPGWRAGGYDVVSHNGLVAVEVQPDDSKVELYFMPADFVAGATVTIISIAGLALLWRRL
ncbi:MAG: hypothetical protein ABH879_02040 [archaeon]